MAAPRKYSDETRLALVQLVTEDGLTIRDACRKLAAGHNDLEPVNVSEHTAGDWIKNAQQLARPDLSKAALPEALDTLARGLFDVIGTEIFRYQRARGPTDPEALLTLAKTLKELQPLASQNPRNGKEEHEPTGTLHALGIGERAGSAATSAQRAPARSLRAQRSSAS